MACGQGPRTALYGGPEPKTWHMRLMGGSQGPSAHSSLKGPHSPAHLSGGVEELHFVAAVANEQEELLGEGRVPHHAGGIVALVGTVDVHDFQVVAAAPAEIVLYLQARWTHV